MFWFVWNTIVEFLNNFIFKILNIEDLTMGINGFVAQQAAQSFLFEARA